LSQKFADEVASGYAAEPEPTRFGVINAFTRAAQKLGPLQRIEVRASQPDQRNAGELHFTNSRPTVESFATAPF
jgi:hypothetical protein